VKQEMLNSSNS